VDIVSQVSGEDSERNQKKERINAESLIGSEEKKRANASQVNSAQGTPKHRDQFRPSIHRASVGEGDGRAKIKQIDPEKQFKIVNKKN